MLCGLKSFFLPLRLSCVFATVLLIEFSTFFEYLTTSQETVTSSHPNIEVFYLEDFNVHNTEWLGSSHTDTGGEEAELFSILNDLKQLIKESTHILDRPSQFLNTFDMLHY